MGRMNTNRYLGMEGKQAWVGSDFTGAGLRMSLIASYIINWLLRIGFASDKA
jgi:hypothetical protein